MSNPKRHHYLPEFYLRRFVDEDGFFYLFDRSQQKIRREQPVNTAVISYYYSLADEHGDRNQIIENFYSLVETRAKLAFDELESGGDFTQMNRDYLSLFLGHLCCRLPSFARALNEIISGVAGEMIRKNLDDPETAKNFDLPPDELREALDSGGPLLEASANTRISTAWKKGNEFGDRFSASSWVVARAPSGTSFLTCDNPFGFVFPPGIPRSASSWSWGATTPKDTIVFPLSVKTCLLMHGMDGLSLERVDLDRDRVRKINEAVIAETETYALARDKPHLVSLARAGGLYNSTPSTRMVVESHPDPSGDPTKSILVVRRSKVR